VTALLFHYFSSYNVLHMKKLIGMVFVAVVAVAVTLLAQGTSSSEGSEVNRYQLHQISENGPQAGAAPTTVVLDTKTGQLWELITDSCPDKSQRQGWRKMPGLGKNEYPTDTFSCAPPPAR
jgi:hypothetical protein